MLWLGASCYCRSLGKRPDCGQQLFVGGEFTETGKAFLGTFDVRPADNAIPVHEELPQELKVRPRGVLAV